LLKVTVNAEESQDCLVPDVSQLCLLDKLWCHLTAIKILTAFPPEDWKRPPGCRQITCYWAVLDDLKSHKFTLTEAVNMAENQPVCRLLTMSEHGREPASLEAAGYE